MTDERKRVKTSSLTMPERIFAQGPALSLPEMLILRRVLKPKLIGIFIAIVAVAIVIFRRSVILARKYLMPLRVCCSLSDGCETWIGKPPEEFVMQKDQPVPMESDRILSVAPSKVKKYLKWMMSRFRTLKNRQKHRMRRSKDL